MHTSTILEGVPTAEEIKYHTSGLIPLTRPQLMWTMTGLMLGLLLSALDQTIVGTAEPKIITTLAGFDRYPWVATAYLLSSTIAVPIFGKLSDIYGRKWFLLGGAATFVGASALCGAAGEINFLGLDGMNQLILFRGLQGFGAGVLMGLIFIIIGDIFSPAERGRYQGLFAAVWGLASIFGPTLGGWLTDHISWRACFYVNLPVGVIVIAAIYLEFPALHPEGIKRVLDWAGVVSLTICIVSLLLALTWANEYGWSSLRIESLLTVSAVTLIAFLYAETKAVEPLIPLSLFKQPVISICSICVFTLGMGMFGVIIYLPLFMQGVLGVSATRSGNLMTPLMMGAVAGSIISGQMNLKLRSYKPAAVIGSILVSIGMILFARMSAASTHADVVWGMVIAGFGMGLLNPVYTVAVQNVAPRHQMGAATSSTTFFRAIGSTVGVAAFGTVFLSRFHRDFSNAIPPGTPAIALAPFKQPLALPQLRPGLEIEFGKYPGGLDLLHKLLAAVPASLVDGLQAIFFASAVIMTAAVLLHLVLPNVRLRAGHQKPPAGVEA